MADAGGAGKSDPDLSLISESAASKKRSFDESIHDDEADHSAATGDEGSLVKKPKLASAPSSPQSVDEGEIVEEGDEEQSDVEVESLTGEVEASERESDEDQGEAAHNPNTGEGTKQKAASGWNRAVTSSLRTSFQSPSLSAPLLPNAPLASSSLPNAALLTSASLGTSGITPGEIDTEPTMEDAAEASGDATTRDQTTKMILASFKGPSRPSAWTSQSRESKRKWSYQKHKWKMPPIFWAIHDADEYFRVWCRSFCELNLGNARVMTSDLLLQGYEKWLDKEKNDRGLSLDDIKAMKDAAQELAMSDEIILLLRDTRARVDPVDPKEAEPTAGEYAALLTNDVEVDDDEPLPNYDSSVPQITAEEELGQLDKYFPGLPEEAVFCVLCASRGHRARECPSRTCKFCEGKHPSTQCKTRQRCAKCQQLGHHKSECQEKLALAPGEYVECAFCIGHDHLEDQCPMLWRTYHPIPGQVARVQSIPAYCYYCGSKAHFGGDCAENKGIHVSGRTYDKADGLWLLANRDIYVNPETEELALSWAPPLPPELPPVERPNIPGRSIIPKTHVYFSESEGEEEFIRAPINRPPAQGQIRVSSDLAQHQHRNREPLANGYANGASHSSNNQRHDERRVARQTRSQGPPPPPNRRRRNRGGNGGGNNGGAPRPSQPNENNQQRGQPRRGPSGNGSGSGGGVLRGGGNLGRRGGRPRRGGA